MENVFQKRRTELLDKLPEFSLVILVGYQQKVRSKNIKYSFRQDNDFYYLTGFDEPDAIALISRDESNDNFTLFCRPKNPHQETNFGERAGIEGAVKIHGATNALPIDSFPSEFEKYLEGIKRIYLSDELNIISSSLIPIVNRQRQTCGFDVIKQYRSIESLAPIIHATRLIKSELEINTVKAAVAASIDGHKEVMKRCAPNVNEAELSAQFYQSIGAHGCKEVAYPNIVASGNNAMCLHYEANNSVLKNGQMLLIDAGAEYKKYASDITRSYPINGRFSAEQKQIYSIVLSALDSAISKVEPNTSWNILYETCMEVMARGLIELGLLTGTFEEVMASHAYKRFTVHKTGHWLGMDVHDVGPYHDEQDNWIKLRPNMVFTIEPGIYIPESADDIPEAYRGIGIRIEDDILVTTTGHENLSAAIPRTIEDIENIMQSE
ncbi:M24 family metallopeptidase [Parashewanella spongiae]|uniref:Xaa-Pro aminopeptidase n=1 Tax=Parashewanella spongiae TaxID=342950 RepID=A0A3A6U5F9_9GAMM|nr:aminopeptidase P N-terminal domain-containing protein [Parashewanella spongiae]MCL1080172.1 aminopeptidase P N-terminal domain-containing protein [Parashewanella spongiae]RJY19448.1 M24 family metallopeptidase [Parashewanella spongiae]